MEDKKSKDRLYFFANMMYGNKTPYIAYQSEVRLLTDLYRFNLDICEECHKKGLTALDAANKCIQNYNDKKEEFLNAVQTYTKPDDFSKWEDRAEDLFKEGYDPSSAASQITHDWIKHYG